jgi:hypothetical protein
MRTMRNSSMHGGNAMDRLTALSNEISSILDQLHQEAASNGARELMAPLNWLDEANGWLKYELARRCDTAPRDPVPWTYIPVDLRK